jgi:hypothetical protein
VAAPSPSSGETASAARAAPSASSVTWRRRSRSSRNACSAPGSRPCVASTRAASSRRRASSAAAPRVSSSWRLRAAPSSRQATPKLLLAAVGVEDVELVARPREPALLELAGHRDQPFGRGGEVLARDRAPPRVRARAAVAEDAPRQHEARLVLRRQLGERGELVVVEEAVRDVELGLDVGLAARRADDAGVALRAEEEADGLGQDRLPRARLAGDRGQAGSGSQLAVANQHEVLDPQATKQRSGCSG